MNVEFREKAFLCKVIDEFRNQWQWIFVGDGPFVEVAIVLDWSKLSVFLSN